MALSDLLNGGLAAKIGKAFAPLFLDATLTRDTFAGPAWDPGEPVPTSFPCKAIHEEWSNSYLTGGLILSGDRKIIILTTSLATVPAPADRITIRGETFTIVPAGSGQPAVSADPALATWTIRARA